MKKGDAMKKATAAVHAGKRQSVNHGGAITPVFTSSAIAYMDDSEVRYPRYLNTINSLVTMRYFMVIPKPA